MNMTQSILDRELINDTSILNIILIGNEPSNFIKFLDKLPHKYLSYEHLYYGNYNPNLIICNNKIDNYNICRELSIRYHIPIITVDHSLKSTLLDNEKIKFIDNLPCSYKIAANIPIHRSWHSIHDKVLPYDINNQQNLESWNKLIIDTSKRVFSL